MDIEPLIGLLQRKPILHGYTHTILGALVIGTVAGIIGRPISAFALRLCKIPHYDFTWTASFVAAFFGAFLHVVLDALMHADMNPWWPAAAGNPLLDAVSSGTLHVACVMSGVLGALVISVRFKAHGRA